MKAAVLQQPGGRLHIEQRPVPVPADDQVLVRVAACGVCGHDQAERLGLTDVPLPAVLGHEIAGTVEATGRDVRGFATGDRVAAKQFATCGTCRSGRELECDRRRFLCGGYAEYVAVDDTALLAVPDEVALPVAAVVACAVGTCLQAFQRAAALQPGETVVVTGAGGGLGLHGLQVARVLGARTVAVTSSAGKVEPLAAWADEVVLAGGEDLWRAIADATGAPGPMWSSTPWAARAVQRLLPRDGRQAPAGPDGPGPLRRRRARGRRGS